MSIPNKYDEMNSVILTLFCPECDQELFEGTLEQCKKWIKSQYRDWKDIGDIEDDVIEFLCNDCCRLMS